MSAQPIDFSSVGGKPASAAPSGAIDFSSIGGKQVEAAQPQEQATISAVKPPQGIGEHISRWAENVSNDLKYGTDSTGIGTVLKAMGAHGVYNGNSKEVGDYMASIPLGLAKMAQGGGEVMQQGKRVQGAGDVAGGALQAATIPASMANPLEAEAGAKAGGAVVDAGKSLLDKIPSKASAGAKFKDVMAAAKDAPVSLDNAQDGILKLMDWQKKTQLGPTINKFLNRVTNPKLGDLTYEEGRDFYQLLGKMSADETMKLAPAIRFDLTKTVIGLKQDIGNAADTVGKGQKYFDAMKEFRNASKMEDISDAAKDVIVEALKRAVPIGFGVYAGKKVLDAAK